MHESATIDYSATHICTDKLQVNDLIQISLGSITKYITLKHDTQLRSISPLNMTLSWSQHSCNFIQLLTIGDQHSICDIILEERSSLPDPVKLGLPKLLSTHGSTEHYNLKVHGGLSWLQLPVLYPAFWYFAMSIYEHFGIWLSCFLSCPCHVAHILYIKYHGYILSIWCCLGIMSHPDLGPWWR